jgi:hypothetical protein
MDAILSNFRIRPLAGCIGAEVDGLDVRRLDDAGFARLRRISSTFRTRTRRSH